MKLFTTVTTSEKHLKALKRIHGLSIKARHDSKPRERGLRLGQTAYRNMEDGPGLLQGY